MLSGDAREGAGPDLVGIGGGFGEGVRQLARTVFSEPKPIIAYEGGPSLYVDGYDWGDPRDDGLTTFIEALNREPRFADIYRIHLNMAKARGLWSHSMFTDSGRWGRYGQWGHLEYPGQAPIDSPKYQFILDWMTEQQALSHVDQVVGAAPSFTTAHYLPVAVYDQPYTADIVVTGGEGGRNLAVIAASLRDGLTIDPLPGDPDRLRVSGVPSAGGSSFIYLRVTDDDGDSAWRTFTVRSVGGPETILEVDLQGQHPALNTPWTSTYVLASNLNYTGLATGAGILPQQGDNAFVFSVNAPANEEDATLANAIADEEFITFTVAPFAGRRLDLAGREMRFGIRRMSYHAPRRYAILSSVGGFTDGAQFFQTDRIADETDRLFRLDFPDSPAYRNLEGPVEIRIYGYQAQYGGHRTSITEVRLDGRLVRCDGDVDGNWLVDLQDHALLVETLGCTGICAADFDGNGRVDLRDFAILQAAFSAGCPD